MASARWEYVDLLRRYRDKQTGQFVSAADRLALRDDFVARQRDAVDDLAARLASGDLTLRRWEAAMQAHVKRVHVVQYALGRGGRNAMTDADREAVGSLVRGQYDYLRSFAEEIATGALSEAKVRARSRLYVDGATQAHERGRTAAFRLTLPQHPGDGQTSCMANCKCSLRVEETTTDWRVTWALGGAEHCEDCRAMAGRWAPLVVEKE